MLVTGQRRGDRERLADAGKNLVARVHGLVMAGWCSSHVPFPLTPALSLRERENIHQSVGETAAIEMFGDRIPRLPLPKGEGWGEGEADVRRPATGPFPRCMHRAPLTAVPSTIL